MFLYRNGKKNFNFLIDILISSSTVTTMIFDCVILLGYYCLVFSESKIVCKIKHQLETYLTSLGIVAILSILVVIIKLLSSPHSHHNQECCSGKNSKNCSLPESLNSTGDFFCDRIRNHSHQKIKLLKNILKCSFLIIGYPFLNRYNSKSL